MATRKTDVHDEEPDAPSLLEGEVYFGGPVRRDSPGVKAHPSMPEEYWEIGRVMPDSPPAIACAAKESDARLIVALPDLFRAAKLVTEDNGDEGHAGLVSKIFRLRDVVRGIEVGTGGPWWGRR